MDACTDSENSDLSGLLNPLLQPLENRGSTCSPASDTMLPKVKVAKRLVQWKEALLWTLLHYLTHLSQIQSSVEYIFVLVIFLKPW